MQKFVGENSILIQKYRASRIAANVLQLTELSCLKIAVLFIIIFKDFANMLVNSISLK